MSADYARWSRTLSRLQVKQRQTRVTVDTLKRTLAELVTAAVFARGDVGSECIQTGSLSSRQSILTLAV
jgi:hypothetical protein